MNSTGEVIGRFTLGGKDMPLDCYFGTGFHIGPFIGQRAVKFIDFDLIIGIGRYQGRITYQTKVQLITTTANITIRSFRQTSNIT